jgi:hypothetical protein
VKNRVSLFLPLRMYLGKGPLGSQRRRREENIKDFGEICFEDRIWMELAQNLAQWRASLLVVLNIWVPLTQCLLVHV